MILAAPVQRRFQASPFFASTRAPLRENRGITAIASRRVPTDCRDGLIFGARA